MTEDEKRLYELHEEGKRRFGSLCKHSRVKNGRCMNCLRKVITRR